MFKKYFWLKLIIIAIVLIVIATIFTSPKNNVPKNDKINFTANSSNKQSSTITNDYSLALNDYSPHIGENNADIIIIEFADFQCSASKEAFPIIRELISEYGNKIKYIYRHFPLADRADVSGKIAEASMCANDQGKFFNFHDKAFQNQDNFSGLSDIYLYAKQIGINTEQFTKCLGSGKYINLIKKDTSDGAKLGIRGTPTWFLFTKDHKWYKIEGAIPKNLFKQAIDDLLKNSQIK